VDAIALVNKGKPGGLVEVDADCSALEDKSGQRLCLRDLLFSHGAILALLPRPGRLSNSTRQRAENRLVS